MSSPEESHPEENPPEAGRAGADCTETNRADEARSREEVSAAFGQALRRRRKEAALTQAQLAERSGLHDTYISFLERGLRQPSLEVTLRLAGALGVPGWRLVRELEETLAE